MNKADVTIGMKVVPHSKSIGIPLSLSDAYRRMKNKGQQFLYVTHRHAEDVRNDNDKFLLSDDEHDIYCFGDYFKSSDFEPYEEIINKDSN